MNKTLFITGTDTGAGKTFLTALLAQFLTEQKIRVAAFKPVCSGGRGDARQIHAALGEELTLDDINPWHFRATIAPSLAAKLEKKSVTRALVLAHIRTKQKNFAVTLVEGAGGLLSPVGKDFNSRDLILALRAVPVIVAKNKLGVVNHLLLTLEALPKSYRAKAKIVLMSPVQPDASAATNAKLLGEFFPVKQIFSLPWLGKNTETPNALKNSVVRKTLSKIV